MPVTAPVAGVAMGLIKEGDDYVVLTDIAGVEDHLGDMDFKVAGTEDGHHRPADGHQDHRRHASRSCKRCARAGQRRPRSSSSARWPRRSTGRASSSARHAPRIESIKIDPEKIGARDRQGRRDDPRPLRDATRPRSTSRTTARSASTPPTASWSRPASSEIEIDDQEAEVGDKFTGKVVKTTTFGAFVELVKGTDGLLHISQRQARRAGRHRRRRDQPGRRDRRDRGRGRPRARPDRPAPLRRSVDRRQDGRGAGRASAPAIPPSVAAAAAAVAGTVAEVAAVATAARGRGGDRERRRRD